MTDREPTAPEDERNASTENDRPSDGTDQSGSGDAPPGSPETPDSDATTAGDARTPDSDATTADEPVPTGGRLDTDRDVIRWLAWGGLATACLVAFVALWQFYSHATSAIATFVATEYESLFLAGFNLAVLLAAGIVISLLVRELADEDGGSPMSANK